MNTLLTIARGLKQLGGAFFPSGDLAYLALTSKSESAIRDKLAVILHNRFNKEYFVAREWRRRFDLAVLDIDQQPIFLIEAKLYFSADLKSEKHSKIVKENLANDAKKLADSKTNCTNKFQLLLVVHPATPPDKQQDSYIKYGKLLRNSPPRDDELIPLIEQHSKKGISGTWDAGEAFGIKVKVYYKLYSTNPSN